jgi:hypothetical protein
LIDLAPICQRNQVFPKNLVSSWLQSLAKRVYYQRGLSLRERGEALMTEATELVYDVFIMYCLEAKHTPKKSLPDSGAISQHFTANHRQKAESTFWR